MHFARTVFFVIALLPHVPFHSTLYGQATIQTTVGDWCETHLDDLETLYRYLHARPELSFQEKETSARFAEELNAIGVQVTTNIGGYGVVGVLENGDGPTLMLRADLDGLPVTEQTRLVYASTAKAINSDGAEVGVMHACAHDIHMTNLIGAARFLAERKSDWQGTILFIGQPAEERGAGAKAMLDDSLFERFSKPDFAIALHVDAMSAAGQIGCRSGYTLANVDSVDITVRGTGGHGAYPHATIDPIVQAAQLVMSLQTIVSREVKPIEPAVVTVGSIHGGTKHNVIGNSCKLQLTVRSYSDKVRRQLHEAIRRKAKAVAMGARAPEPEVVISEGTPSLWNDEDLAARVVPAFGRELGEENVMIAEQSMGGEDFSRYGEAGVPILMFRLGTVEPRRLARFKQLGQLPPSLHSAQYYPDARDTLKTGIRAMVSAALELLKKDERK